jgi:hypothetical protein
MKQNLPEYLTENIFYNDGLRFQCQKCSNCCRKAPGYVFLNRKDLRNISIAIKKQQIYIIKEYCRIVDISGFKRLSLREKSNFDCIFWENDGCKIYKKRPLQCKSYPFWAHNLESIQTWNNLKHECPGIDKGKKLSKKVIDHWINYRVRQGLLTEKDIEDYFIVQEFQ